MLRGWDAQREGRKPSSATGENSLTRGRTGLFSTGIQNQGGCVLQSGVGGIPYIPEGVVKIVSFSKDERGKMTYTV